MESKRIEEIVNTGERTPNFDRFLTAVKKSPLQKKKIEKFLSTCDDVFFDRAEVFSKQYIAYLDHEKIDVAYAVEAYQKLCSDMMKCQMFFLKTGKYPVSSSEEANAEIYSNEKVMKLYMIGLALSQFLWPSHYEIYSFLLDNIKKYSPGIKSYLEIGPGHGLFLNNAVDLIPSNSRIVAVDISNTSMDITRSIIHYFRPEGGNNISYMVADMLQLDLHDKYDFITMGEVLEHVNFPETLLRKLRELLTDNGRAFVSTCVNCPAIDHVYHFKFVDEIREMFKACGLKIESEVVAPVEDLPMEEIVSRKITINYCALLSKL